MEEQLKYFKTIVHKLLWNNNENIHYNRNNTITICTRTRIYCGASADLSIRVRHGEDVAAVQAGDCGRTGDGVGRAGDGVG